MTFDIRVTANMDLMKMDKELQTLEEVWSLVNEWDEAWEGYKSTCFWKIETEQMEEFSNELYRYTKVIYLYVRLLVENKKNYSPIKDMSIV